MIDESPSDDDYGLPACFLCGMPLDDDDVNADNKIDGNHICIQCAKELTGEEVNEESASEEIPDSEPFDADDDDTQESEDMDPDEMEDMYSLIDDDGISEDEAVPDDESDVTDDEDTDTEDGTSETQEEGSVPEEIEEDDANDTIPTDDATEDETQPQVPVVVDAEVPATEEEPKKKSRKDRKKEAKQSKKNKKDDNYDPDRFVERLRRWWLVTFKGYCKLRTLSRNPKTGEFVQETTLIKHRDLPHDAVQCTNEKHFYCLDLIKDSDWYIKHHYKNMGLREYQFTASDAALYMMTNKIDNALTLHWNGMEHKDWTKIILLLGIGLVAALIIVMRM